jgi:thermitase
MPWKERRSRRGRFAARVRIAHVVAFAAFAAPIAAVALDDRQPPADLGLERPVSAASAAGGGGRGASSEPAAVIVRFERDADAADRRAARGAADVAFEQTLPVAGMQVVRPDAGTSVQEAVARLEQSGSVRYAEPDVERRAFVTPDDEFFTSQWGLHNTGQAIRAVSGTVDADIDAPEAWDLTTGSREVTIAVIDSGVDPAHPDLAPNMWRNGGESGDGREANGVDDDGNGFVDDLRGWDFADGDPAPDDASGHGTHVAGTIAARGGDGVGVAGVSWGSALLPLRVLGADGSGVVSAVIAAYGYAARKQVPIVNVSLGGAGPSLAERDAIRAAPNTLFVVAAGNTGANVDTTGAYPCAYDEPNVVCVAATDQNDALASFSNHGVQTVDLAAPGVNIASAYTAGRWALLDGTSMAAPHVAGVAALIRSVNPGASVADVRARLLDTVEQRPHLIGRIATGGVVNAARAVAPRAAAPSAAETAPPTAAETPPPATAEAPPPATAPVPQPTPDAAPAPAPSPGSTAATPPSTLPFSPPPALAPPAGRDADAPGVRLVVERPPRLSRALQSGLVAAVRCAEACTVRGALRMRARDARAAGLTRGTRDVTVATGRGRVNSPSTVRVRLRFTSAARRRLGARRTVALVAGVTAVDAAGNARSVSRRVTLRR